MDTASGYYRPGTSWLHRRYPTTKLLLLLWLLAAAFLLPPLALPLLVGVVWVAAASVGLFGQALRSSRVGLALLASILVVNGFFYPGAQEILVGFGPFALTWEGLSAGLVFAGRVLVALEASLLFLFTTLADDLLEALVSRGINPRIAFVVLSAMQLVPRAQARAAAILDAQQARGLLAGTSMAQRLRSLVPLAGPLLLGTIIEVRDRTYALEARGFGSGRPRTAFRVVADPPFDRPLRLLTVAGFVALVAAALLGLGSGR